MPKSTTHAHPSLEQGPLLQRERCAECAKRLPLLPQRCLCEKYFCGRHIAAERHHCTHDYRTDWTRELQEKLVRLEDDRRLEKLN